MSSTSAILGHVSVFRNPTADAQSSSCFKVIAAQCAYMVIVPYAIVEAAISQIVRAITYCMLNKEQYQKIINWTKSSANSLIWAVHCVFVNLCIKNISPTENDFKAHILKMQPQSDPKPQPIMRRPRPGQPVTLVTPVVDRPSQQTVAPDEPIIVPSSPEQPPQIVDLIEPIIIRPTPEQPVNPVSPEPAPISPMPQPVIAMPTSKDPAIAKLLNKYCLGDNAKKYSDLMEKIYREIPEPDDLQLYGLVTQLTMLLKQRGEARIRNKILFAFEEISLKIDAKRRLSVWEERLLKMTVAIYNAINKLEGDELEAGKEILILGLLDAFQNCSNRQSAEIERLYFRYVAPKLLAEVEAAATPVETLIFELMQFRTRIRDEIINRQCPDAHNAASHRYFRKKLNVNTFYLPKALLSAEDEHYAEFAMQEREHAIIAEFQKIYDKSGTIYDIFIGLLYPRANESFRFKSEMFVKWLNETGRMNPDAFSDEDMFVYKPEIMITFLEEQGFLKKRGRAF